jgi:hypothetical protein
VLWVREVDQGIFKSDGADPLNIGEPQLDESGPIGNLSSDPSDIRCSDQFVQVERVFSRRQSDVA